MKKISIDSIMEKVKDKIKREYDIVIAIGRGGILPAYLISRYLDIPLKIIYSEFRNEKHEQKFKNPKIHIHKDILNLKNYRILLVDDISNTGKTINKVKQKLLKNIITTAVIYGDADISLFGSHDECIKWPWE